MNTIAILLAAGKGTRMKSKLPKVLHQICGKTMVEQVMYSIRKAGIGDSILVVGHGADEVEEMLGPDNIYVNQAHQFGTGHAVKQAIPAIPAGIVGVLVACGDTPLLTVETLNSLKEHFFETQAACTILTAEMPDPTGYGRIVRDEKGNVVAIVEEKDATPEQKLIHEINTGTYFFNAEWLKEAVSNLKNDNAQSEYYLTDTISYLAEKGQVVNTFMTGWEETMGVNDRVQLAKAAEILRDRKCKELMLSGVTIVDPKTTYIDLGVVVGQDTIIEPGVHLRGRTVIGANCVIGRNTDIYTSIIGDNCTTEHSLIKESMVGTNVKIGPYAHLRPGTVLGHNVKIGDFCEVKNSNVGDGSKVPHLSYIGDAHIGEDVNIGCGTITCNYDGVVKSKTFIEDRAFIGSNTNLIAPVRVGADSIVAAGSTITDSVPANALAIARERQIVKENYNKKSKRPEVQVKYKEV